MSRRQNRRSPDGLSRNSRLHIGKFVPMLQFVLFPMTEHHLEAKLLFFFDACVKELGPNQVKQRKYFKRYISCRQ